MACHTQQIYLTVQRVFRKPGSAYFENVWRRFAVFHLWIRRASNHMIKHRELIFEMNRLHSEANVRTTCRYGHWYVVSAEMF